jgi:hypothetical protein
MGQVHKIKKGLDIRLVGEADKVVAGSGALHTIMVSPEDFFGIRPKTLVTAGDEVLAGTPIMFDKNNESHKIVTDKNKSLFLNNNPSVTLVGTFTAKNKLHIGLNLNHFHKMLKSINKKYYIILLHVEANYNLSRI